MTAPWNEDLCITYYILCAKLSDTDNLPDPEKARIAFVCEAGKCVSVQSPETKAPTQRSQCRPAALRLPAAPRPPAALRPPAAPWVGVRT